MRERMDETFRLVLEEVRLDFRLNREMGEALIKLLLEKEEVLADEVEKFFDQYGLYTPKVVVEPEKKTEEVVIVGREDQPESQDGDQPHVSD